MTEPAPLDLTSDSVEPGRADVEVHPVELQREGTRRLIAVCLLASLAVVAVAWAAVGVWGDAADVTAAGGALDKVFTGVLGLAGTVVGFFFGAATAQGTASKE